MGLSILFALTDSCRGVNDSTLDLGIRGNRPPPQGSMLVFHDFGHWHAKCSLKRKENRMKIHLIRESTKLIKEVMQYLRKRITKIFSPLRDEDPRDISAI